MCAVCTQAFVIREIFVQHKFYDTRLQVVSTILNKLPFSHSFPIYIVSFIAKWFFLFQTRRSLTQNELKEIGQDLFDEPEQDYKNSWVFRRRNRPTSLRECCRTRKHWQIWRWENLEEFFIWKNKCYKTTTVTVPTGLILRALGIESELAVFPNYRHIYDWRCFEVHKYTYQSAESWSPIP